MTYPAESFGASGPAHSVVFDKATTLIDKRLARYGITKPKAFRSRLSVLVNPEYLHLDDQIISEEQ